MDEMNRRDHVIESEWMDRDHRPDIGWLITCAECLERFAEEHMRQVDVDYWLCGGCRIRLGYEDGDD